MRAKSESVRVFDSPTLVLAMMIMIMIRVVGMLMRFIMISVVVGRAKI